MPNTTRLNAAQCAVTAAQLPARRARPMGTTSLPRADRDYYAPSGSAPARQPLPLRNALAEPHVRLLHGHCHDHGCHGGAHLQTRWANGEPDPQSVPACCQSGAMDLDEGMSLLTLGEEHHHLDWRLALPKTVGQGAGTGLSMYGGVLGMFFGWLNFTHSGKTLKDIELLLGNVRDELDVLASQSEPSLALTAEIKNLKAREQALVADRGMQRFIRWGAGALPVVTAALMVVGLFVPPVGLASTATLALYCFAHAVRYALWDWRRAAVPVPAATHGAAPFLATPGSALTLAQQGHAQVQRAQRWRQAIFGSVAGCFAMYGVGAAVFVAGTALGSAALMVGGVVPLLLGTAAVFVLNNWTIKDAFINNQNTHLDRQHLGSKESMLRQVGGMHAEREALKHAVHALHQRPESAAWREPRWRRALHQAVVLGSGAVPFVPVSGWMNARRHGALTRRFHHVTSAEILSLIQPLCTRKAQALREEHAALTARARRKPEAAHDIAPTAQWVAAWAAKEDALAQRAAADDVSDADALEMLWQFFANRDALDDRMSNLAAALPETPGAWWKTEHAHVHLHATQAGTVRVGVHASDEPNAATVVLRPWQNALRRQDPEAQRQFVLLRANMMHYLMHEYGAALSSRMGSITDQLVSRVLTKA